MVAKQPGGRARHLARRNASVAPRPPYCNLSQERATEMVWVSAYTRIRFGRLEYVSAHYRSLP